MYQQFSGKRAESQQQIQTRSFQKSLHLTPTTIAPPQLHEASLL
jgi:hypothetical protein